MKSGNDTSIIVSSERSDDVLLRFAQLLDGQSLICDELEKIADTLPNAVDLQSCLRTAQKLLPLVKLAHDFEECELFPMLLIEAGQAAQHAATIERLRYEHWGDEEFALDIHHALREFARKHDTAKVEALAWMLRGFFDGLRRHLAFDREYLIPILKKGGTIQSKI